ncbi:uncharacterized protein LOC121908279 [Thunnus maccoyii]|uniref:uncharacterized protein LOC121908279 n=1 Tax=Thunnus maccoyii TaxID=8240 RepID=UPI001C4B53A1|nr:uncharacterized protein LOC121908279 [Thunnus maccoyii]
MFLAHSTVLKSSRAASSQMLSMPMALSGPACWLYWCPYRLLGPPRRLCHRRRPPCRCPPPVETRPPPPPSGSPCPPARWCPRWDLPSPHSPWPSLGYRTTAEENGTVSQNYWLLSSSQTLCVVFFLSFGPIPEMIFLPSSETESADTALLFCCNPLSVSSGSIVTHNEDIPDHRKQNNLMAPTTTSLLMWSWASSSRHCQLRQLQQQQRRRRQ